MTKREFLKNFATLGLATPFMTTLLASCSQKVTFYPNLENNFTGKVLIIGAGAAGITAGHILQKEGVDFQILEAASIHGGRVKKTTALGDFPIDLGAEWIHTDPSILAKLYNRPEASANIDIITYNPQTTSVWRDDRLRRRNIARHFYSEYKFKRSTWFDFFDQYMIPGIQDKIAYNSPVAEIDYSGTQVIVRTVNNEVYTADKVLITVPITILQQGDITFVPALPADKQAAIDEEWMPDGLKVFVEFSERFYPDMVVFDNLLASSNDGDHAYYDAAFGKESDRNVFALFTVGDKASRYIAMGDDDAIFAEVMRELDAMFEGKASQHYVRHIVQNWTKEPYIRGSYSHGYGSPEALAAPVADRLYFAGEAMAPDGDTSTAHGAAASAYAEVEKLLVG
ncbi:MAG: NAD(P)/FAD-dependent oxidoreductase [Bacteroidota bacterium]